MRYTCGSALGRGKKMSEVLSVLEEFMVLWRKITTSPGTNSLSSHIFDQTAEKESSPTISDHKV